MLSSCVPGCCCLCASLFLAVCLCRCLVLSPGAPVSAAEGEEGHSNTFEAYDVNDEGVDVHNVALLSNLTRLTSLELNMQDRKPNKCFWRSLAQLTALKSLTMKNLHFDYLGGVLKLAACQQLTHLRVESEDSWPRLLLKVGGDRGAGVC